MLVASNVPETLLMNVSPVKIHCFFTKMNVLNNALNKILFTETKYSEFVWTVMNPV
jgi:hypothetical protein